MVAKKFKTLTLLLICIMIIALCAAVLVACDDSNKDKPDSKNTIEDVDPGNLTVNDIAPLFGFVLHSGQEIEKLSAVHIDGADKEYREAGLQYIISVYNDHDTGGFDRASKHAIVYFYDNKQNASNALPGLKEIYSSGYFIHQKNNKIYIESEQWLFENEIMTYTLKDGDLSLKQIQLIEKSLSFFANTEYDFFQQLLLMKIKSLYFS